MTAVWLVPLLVAYPLVLLVRRPRWSRSRLVAVSVLVLYGLAVLALTVFPIVPHPPSYWAGEPWWTMVHWMPFDVDGPSSVLNVLMFVPFGVLAPLLWPRTDAVRRLAAYGAGVSALIELTQLVLGVTIGSRRTVDVNDLLANTAGALVGLALLRLAIPLRRHRATVVAQAAVVTQPAAVTQRVD